MSKKRYLQELKKQGGVLYRSFLQWSESITSTAQLERLAEVVSQGDPDLVMQLLEINEPSTAVVAEALRSTYIAGGNMESVKVAFDMRNPRAEQLLKTHSSKLITGYILDEQREAIREVLRFGMQQNQAPRATALDIVGRMDRTKKKRTGGIVGLTGPQVQYVTRAKEQLLSGDPELMEGYLTRQRRDRRFDGIVMRAIEAEKPVAKADVDRIVSRYSDRLLKLRGDTIARTETLTALNAGRDEAWQQAIEQGKVEAQDIVKVWSSTGDSRTRSSHMDMNGDKKAENEPFVTPDGFRLMYPGDTSLGAPASETINCRCYMYREVDYIGAQARAEREL